MYGCPHQRTYGNNETGTTFWRPGSNYHIITTVSKTRVVADSTYIEGKGKDKACAERDCRKGNHHNERDVGEKAQE